MPVTFAPADPYSASVASEYGRSQAQNQIDARESQERIAARHDATQAGIATGEMNMRSAIESARNTRQGWDEEFQANERRRQQERLIQAQQESQFNEWALRGQAVSQHEILQMNRQERAVNEIANQVSNGFLTKEEAAPLVAEIRTGINTTQRRLQEQQAQQSMAREKQIMEQTASQAAILKQNQLINGRTAEENIVPDAGAMLIERKKLRPKYQAIAAVIGAEAAQDALNKEARENVIERRQYRVQTGTDGRGNATFHDDVAAHAKDPAEAEAKQFDLQVKHHEAEMRVYEHTVDRYDREFKAAVDAVRKIHETRMKGGTEKDEPGMDQVYEEARNDLKARGVKPPGEPPAPPSQKRAGEPAAPPANDPILSAIAKNSDLHPEEKAKGAAIAAQIQALLRKPKDQLTPADKARYLDLKKQAAALIGD